MMDQIYIEEMHRQCCLGTEKEGGSDMTEEQQLTHEVIEENIEAGHSEKSKKQEKKVHTDCTVCGENPPDYTKDGKAICHACREFPANVTEQFFNFKLGEFARISVKGFHPSPLPEV